MSNTKYKEFTFNNEDMVIIGEVDLN